MGKVGAIIFSANILISGVRHELSLSSNPQNRMCSVRVEVLLFYGRKRPISNAAPFMETIAIFMRFHIIKARCSTRITALFQTRKLYLEGERCSEAGTTIIFFSLFLLHHHHYCIAGERVSERDSGQLGRLGGALAAAIAGENRGPSRSLGRGEK